MALFLIPCLFFFAKTDKIVDIRFVTSFYRNEAYIKYFADKIKKKLANNNFDGILFSYHGIPQAYADDGDRYPYECEETTRLIMAQLSDMPHFHCYQSTYGRDKWLSPKTEEIVHELPKKGIKRLLVLAPGFLADNLETLLELKDEARTAFMEAGGDNFYYISTFNSDIELANILKEVIK